MKKIVVIVALICLNFKVQSQNSLLLGRWQGEHEAQKLTLVFVTNGRGIWKVTDQFDNPDVDCECSVTVSAPMTWKIKSDKIFIDVGTASGAIKMKKNDNKYEKVREACSSTCKTLLEILKSGISKKYSDDLIFEGKHKLIDTRY